jgi:FKBP-type peptidyl-prolyl cis-trans isomerase
MKNKNLLIAVIVLGVLGAIAFFTSNNGQSNQSSDKSGIGKEVVTKLDPTKITKITITDKDGSVSLEMNDEKWTVTERDGFIANFENIQKLVSSAVTLKSLRQVRASKKQHGRFELIDPSVEKENSGTKVDFKDTDNNVLKSLVLGKKNSSQSGANAGSPFGSSDNQRFVLVDGKISVIEIDFSSALNDIEASASEWIQKDDFLKIEKIKSVSISQPNAEDSWTVNREKEGDDMNLLNPKEGEKLDSSKGNSAGRVFGFANFDDVASKSAKSEDIGMDKAVTANIETFEGYKYDIKMAKKGEDHYMTVVGSGSRIAQEDESKARVPQPDESKPREPGKEEKQEDKERLDKEHSDNIAQLVSSREKSHNDNQVKLKSDRDKEFTDNLTKLKKLEGWSFKVSSFTFDAIYKTRAEMMEEEKEEEEESTNTTNTSIPANDNTAQKNKVAGEAFLTENKSKEGITATESGLQYKTIKEGNGPSPTASDTVTVNYKGTLIDGKEFDSGEGISFPLNGVIKGWTEGLQLMKSGGSTRFFIPSDLAYGSSGPPNIGPNSTLIFDVDLISIKGKEKAASELTQDAPKKVVTSDIIKVPSAEELKKGAKIEVIKKEDLEAEIEKAKQEQKNQPEKNIGDKN